MNIQSLSFAIQVIVFLGLVLPGTVAQAQTAKELFKKAEAALKNKQTDAALAYSNRAIKLVPKNAAGYVFRGTIYLRLAKPKPKEAMADFTKAIQLDPNLVPAYVRRGTLYQLLRQHKKAEADWSKVIQLAPKLSQAYQARGVERFKLGNFKGSVKDFNKYLKLVPKAKPSHWQRGISFYYAKQYKEGKLQFEGYQTYKNNDVENAVWRYLCMVPLVGKKRAQADMLEIKGDTRVPMNQIYDMFAGKLTPEDVLKAAKAGKPGKDELHVNLFYAHLYIGLYHASDGKKDLALKHLQLAAETYPIGHYMWDVARVHRDLLKTKKKSKK